MKVRKRLYMTVKFGCIVEGHSEVESVPILIRRIAADLYPELNVLIPPPIRVPRERMVKIGVMERGVEVAARRIQRQGPILIILDGDDDCPAELGPMLLNSVSEAHSDLSIAVIVAEREFETWFLAAVESLRGRRGLKTDIEAPEDPEAIRDAKGWLSSHMEGGTTYSERREQPALTALFDMQQARNADLFDKCYRDIVRLLRGAQARLTETSEQN